MQLFANRKYVPEDLTLQLGIYIKDWIVNTTFIKACHTLLFQVTLDELLTISFSKIHFWLPLPPDILIQFLNLNIFLNFPNIMSWHPFLLFLGAFVKLQKGTISYVTSVCLPVRQSVCPLGTTLDEFSRSLVLEYFTKIWPENSSVINIWQEWRVL
jgi:hypothetical protein